MFQKVDSTDSLGLPKEKSLVDPELQSEKSKLIELKQRDMKLKNAKPGEEVSAQSEFRLEHPLPQNTGTKTDLT